MAKWANDSIMDAALDEAATATQLLVCTSEPATRAAAITAAVATTNLVAAFTKADGDTNGRKVTIAAQNGLTVDANGTATHVVLIDGVDLLYVTTCTSQAVTSGNVINVPAWKIEISDPS